MSHFLQYRPLVKFMGIQGAFTPPMPRLPVDSHDKFFKLSVLRLFFFCEALEYQLSFQSCSVESIMVLDVCQNMHNNKT